MFEMLGILKSWKGLKMSIQIGSYKTAPCQPFQNDPTITRTIIWQRITRPKPSPKSLYSYGPIYGSGHECQLSPEQNKYALSHQFSTFEEATRFCKERKNICGILVELTLQGTLRFFSWFFICRTYTFIPGTLIKSLIRRWAGERA